MVSPGSVQREQHSRALVLPPGRAQGSARLAGRGLAFSGLRRGLARDWTGQRGLPCPQGWLGSIAEDQGLRPLLEPSLSLLLE